MRIALVTSSLSSERHGVGRHVQQLAAQLSRRGATVEVITPAAIGLSPRAPDRGDVVVHRFSSVTGPARFAASSELRQRLRTIAGSFDVADVHSTRSTFAFAAARAGFRRLVFTAHSPLERMLGWPHGHATGAVLGSATQIVCRSQADQDRLCARFPGTADRTEILPVAIDVEAIRAATPMPAAGTMILSSGRLLRTNRIDRAIAALAALGPEFRLVIAGRGPDRHRLRAYAADLRVASRVSFIDSPSEPELFRWLRTAQVVVALGDESSSGVEVIEGLAAGARVVASDIPVHREFASRFASERVTLLPPLSSPLAIADAIRDAGRRQLLSASRVLVDIPSWETVIDSTWALYERLMLSSSEPRRGLLAAVDEPAVQLAVRHGEREI